MKDPRFSLQSLRKAKRKLQKGLIRIQKQRNSRKKTEFRNEWIEMFLFTANIKGLPMCLICGELYTLLENIRRLVKNAPV